LLINSTARHRRDLTLPYPRGGRFLGPTLMILQFLRLVWIVGRFKRKVAGRSDCGFNSKKRTPIEHSVVPRRTSELFTKEQEVQEAARVCTIPSQAWLRSGSTCSFRPQSRRRQRRDLLLKRPEQSESE